MMNGLFLKQQLVTGGFKMCKAGIKRRYCCFSKTQSCWKKSGEKTACYLRNPIKTLGYSNHINDCENLPDFWLPSMATYHIGSNLPLRFGKMRIARKATSLAPLLRYEASTPLKCQMLELGRVNHRIRSTKHVKTAAFLVKNSTPKIFAFFNNPPEKRGDSWQAKQTGFPAVPGDSPSCRRLRHLTCLSRGLLATRNENIWIWLRVWLDRV